MFLRTKINKSIKNFSSNIDILREKLKRPMLFLLEQEQGFQQLQDSLIQENVLINIFLISRINMALKTCIPGDFILMLLLRNIGHIGQDIYTSIDT